MLERYLVGLFALILIGACPVNGQNLYKSGSRQKSDWHWYESPALSYAVQLPEFISGGRSADTLFKGQDEWTVAPGSQTCCPQTTVTVPDPCTIAPTLATKRCGPPIVIRVAAETLPSVSLEQWFDGLVRALPGGAKFVKDIHRETMGFRIGDEATFRFTFARSKYGVIAVKLGDTIYSFRETNGRIGDDIEWGIFSTFRLIRPARGARVFKSVPVRLSP